jgi:type VI secretion system secreted protein Hcp
MAADYFLKIDGVEGESKDAKHTNEIQLESWSFGVSQTGTSVTGQGLGGGKANFQDFHFTMKVQKASPVLFLKCATGEHIGKAVLSCRKSGTTQQDYNIWTFSELIISSFQTGGTGAGDDLPMDSISFNYSKIEVEYKMQNDKGIVGSPVKAGYNLKQNKKV